jgi:hypothetical protein
LSKGVYLVPADKNCSEFTTPYITLSECTFLKRMFIERDGIVYCPIEMATIEKLLSMYVDEGTFSHEEHTIRVANEALDELVQYGPDDFKRFDGLISTALFEVGLVTTMSTFDERWEKLKPKYNLKQSQ